MKRKCVYTFCHGEGVYRTSDSQSVVLPNDLGRTDEQVIAYIMLCLTAGGYKQVDSIEIDVEETEEV